MNNPNAPEANATAPACGSACSCGCPMRWVLGALLVVLAVVAGYMWFDRDEAKPGADARATFERNQESIAASLDKYAEQGDAKSGDAKKAEQPALPKPAETPKTPAEKK